MVQIDWCSNYGVSNPQFRKWIQYYGEIKKTEMQKYRLFDSEIPNYSLIEKG